jgi:hypothetical protein
MKGAYTEFDAQIKIIPKKKSIRIIGKSQYFFLSRKY